MPDADVYLDEGLRLWVTKTAWENRWRVPSWYTIQDLEQDGMVVYCKCRNKYANSDRLGTIGDPNPEHKRRNFMVLFKTAYINHIMTLAAKKADGTEYAISQLVDDSPDPWTAFTPPEQESLSLSAALKNAPKEIAELFDKLAQDGLEAAGFVRSRLRTEGRHLHQEGGRVRVQGARVTQGRLALRETTVQYIDRVLGEPGAGQRVIDYIRS
jgi:hypothetical protein